MLDCVIHNKTKKTSIQLANANQYHRDIMSGQIEGALNWHVKLYPWQLVSLGKQQIGRMEAQKQITHSMTSLH